MKILALDTTSALASIALLEDDRVLAEKSWQEKASHTELLPAYLSQVLDQAQLRLPEMDLFVVARGPGSFTGIRIGLAFVKGLALGAEKPVAGISSLEAMTRWMPEGLLCPVLDAKRGQVFGAIYERRGATLEIILEEGAFDPKDFFAQCLARSQASSKPAHFSGSGLKAYEAVCREVFQGQTFEECPTPRQGLARALAQTAFQAQQNGKAWGRGEDLQAHYLRASAAQCPGMLASKA